MDLEGLGFLGGHGQGEQRLEDDPPRGPGRGGAECGGEQLGIVERVDDRRPDRPLGGPGAGWAGLERPVLGGRERP